MNWSVCVRHPLHTFRVPLPRGWLSTSCLFQARWTSSGVRSLRRKKKSAFFFFKALFLSHSCSAQEKYSHECEEQLPIDSGRNRCWISCPCSFRAAGGRQSAATLQGSLNQLAWILPSPRILACKTDFVHFATFECTAQIDFVAVLRCTDGVWIRVSLAGVN